MNPRIFAEAVMSALSEFSAGQRKQVIDELSALHNEAVDNQISNLEDAIADAQKDTEHRVKQLEIQIIETREYNEKFVDNTRDDINDLHSLFFENVPALSDNPDITTEEAVQLKLKAAMQEPKQNPFSQAIQQAADEKLKEAANKPLKLSGHKVTVELDENMEYESDDIKLVEQVENTTDEPAPQVDEQTDQVRPEPPAENPANPFGD